VSVNDDVVESDGHADSMRGTLDRIPGSPRTQPVSGRWDQTGVSRSRIAS
jgi:hypothetical protein